MLSSLKKLNKLVKNSLYSLIVFHLLIFSYGCLRSQCIEIENANYRAEMLNPELTAEDTFYGGRFIRAGWLKSLHSKGEKESIIHSRSVFSSHCAFGYAHEIYPPVKLQNEDNGVGRLFLNIGVGIVKQKTDKRFDIEVIRLFPWESTIKQNNNNIIVQAEQRSGNHYGYAYKLVSKTVFRSEKMEIDFEYMLKNTGSKKIVTNAYEHPFFVTEKGFGKSFFALGQNLKELVSKTQCDKLYDSSQLKPNTRSIKAGVDLSGKLHLVTISSSQIINKVLFWKYINDCFAIEPFIQISLKPEESQTWKWTLLVKEYHDEKR